MSEIKESKDFIRGVFQKAKNQSNKKLVVIYVTKEQKEIHRDWNPVYIPVETNLITFKNIDASNIFGDLKETLFYVANVEYQVPSVVIITLLGQTDR
jgi:hypothetical protein